MKVHAVVARALSDLGVKTMFGLMGDQNMLYITDFVRDHDGHFVAAVTEGGAVGMADGYARRRRRVGVATVTHGPALTNTVTALTEATRAGSSVVVLTGATPPIRDYPQAIDLAAVVAPTGADYRRVLAPQQVADDIALAISAAETAERPVVLDLPFAMLDADVDYRLTRTASYVRQAVGPDPAALDRALGIMASADRPLIVAGHGVVRAGGAGDVGELADVLGAPVATTLLGRDLFRKHPYNLGVVGTLSDERAMRVSGQADCVIAFGASLNEFTTANNSLTKGRPVVQVDVRESAFSRFRPPTAPVYGDAATVARAMSAALKDAGHTASGFATEAMRASGEPVAARRTSSPDREGVVNLTPALKRLDQVLPEQRVIVTDVGRFLASAWRHLFVGTAGDFLHTANFGSIGLGLGVAIGAATSVPEQVTVAVLGDGGAMMSLAEFTTAVREQLRLVVVVVNDAAYGAEYVKLRSYGVDPDYARMSWPEFSDVATAYGGHAIVVRSVADLDAVAGAIAANEFPLLVDVKVDPSASLAMFG
jgi:thiamine pyrophosphate-dependent acetolactate synthase large subunit-like protein